MSNDRNLVTYGMLSALSNLFLLSLFAALARPFYGRKSVGQKVLLLLVGSLAIAAPIASGEANATQIKTDDLPAFDVVSIRQHEPGYRPTFGQMRFTDDGFIGKNVLIQAIIVLAYDLRDPVLTLRSSLLPGGPKWIQSDWYDILAKISPGEMAELNKLNLKDRSVQQRLMLQALLAERFQLKVHSESRESPAYRLILTKKGPKNMKEEPDSAASDIRWTGSGHGEYRAQQLPVLIGLLENLLHVPILDETGLKGRYDFTLDWTRDPSTMPANAPPSDPSGPSIFTALQDELGLKLVPAKALLESIVIDGIERPSQN